MQEFPHLFEVGMVEIYMFLLLQIFKLDDLMRVSSVIKVVICQHQ